MALAVSLAATCRAATHPTDRFRGNVSCGTRRAMPPEATQRESTGRRAGSDPQRRITNGNATLYNTIVALNTDGTGPGAQVDNIYGDGEGTVSDLSAYNLLGTGGNTGLTSGGSNDNLVGVANPELGMLANNGGPTQTIALLAGSPAITAGSVSLAVNPQGSSLATDQRGAGFPRVVNGKVDIGAFETQATIPNPAPSLTTIAPSEAAVDSALPVTLTVTGTGFISQSVVDWNTTPLATTDISSTELTATIPPSDLAFAEAPSASP